MLKEAFTELCWNRLKLVADKAELVNMFFASAKGGKGRRSAYKVFPTSMLNSRVQERAQQAVDEE